jgi:hypothetical protein
MELKFPWNGLKGSSVGRGAESPAVPGTECENVTEASPLCDLWLTARLMIALIHNVFSALLGAARCALTAADLCSRRFRVIFVASGARLC